MTPLRLDFALDEGAGERARIGAIVLQTDRTLEAELSQIRIDGVELYHSRIAMDVEVTPESLRSMEARLPEAARLLPRQFDFAAIGYGCTSAATLIGEPAVTAAIQAAHPGVPCTNPITAALAAFRALDVDRIAVVTPYSAEVTAPVIELFANEGISVTAVGSFLEESDLLVSRISEESVANAVSQIATASEMAASCQAVFVSCTSVRAFGVIESLEANLGIPVVSSNLAFGWHLLRLSGIDDTIDGLGQLMGTPA